MTAEEFEEKHLEIADSLAGTIAARLITCLGVYNWESNSGTLFVNTDFDLPGIGKRRIEIAYCSYQTLLEIPRDIVPVAPDLAIEVTAKYDKMFEVDDKIAEYQQANVKLIWIIRPVGEIIEVYKNDKAPELLNIDSILDGESVIPGFKLPVRKLFQVPKKTVIDSSTNSK